MATEGEGYLAFVEKVVAEVEAKVAAEAKTSLRTWTSSGTGITTTSYPAITTTGTFTSSATWPPPLTIRLNHRDSRPYGTMMKTRGDPHGHKGMTVVDDAIFCFDCGEIDNVALPTVWVPSDEDDT